VTRNFDIENDKWLQGIYIGEISSLCDQITMAVNGLNQALNSGAATNPTQSTFFFLRSIVSNSATVSQFLWAQTGARPRVHLRAKTLRKIFKISDNSILKDRSFRHHLIHVDERLDKWAVESPNRILFRRNIGSRNDLGGNWPNSGDVFEYYIPEECTFIFRGDEFNVQSIVHEVSTIKKMAVELESRR
jgi:hypothetical protein